MATNPLTKLTQKAFNDACRDFTVALKERGFSKTKTRMWVRINKQTIDVVTLFREGSSYGAPSGGTLDIRLNSAIRSPAETTDYLALNGPQSDVARTRSGKYHLRFRVESRHMYERCMTDLIRFVDSECEPWFIEMQHSEATLDKDGLCDPSVETQKVLGLRLG
ncbi:DUF4304 domain-containing protein [Posidoniimonas polymericola]|nr:DUF4304 domain-containing protein [Posidoniimonas polymericola]